MMTGPVHHLNKLCVEIGARPIGTRGNFEAADYITQVLRSAGLEVSEQRFDCPAWQAEAVTLDLNGERLEAIANFFSPACAVAAPLAAACTVAELEATELTGRIAVLYGDLGKEPLIPKHCLLYNTERDQKMI